MIELLERTLEGLFRAADARGSERERRGEADDPRGQLWESLEKHGLLTPFQNGLTRWSEGGALIRAASRHAAGIPFAEHALASYLAEAQSASVEFSHVSVADPFASELVLSGQTVSGLARFVPHAALSSQLWVEAQSAPREYALALVQMRGVEAMAGQNLAGEPRDTLVLRGAPVIASRRIESAFGAHGTGHFDDRCGPLGWLGALTRATQMAALAEMVLELSLEHARTRQQFGAAVASFQAVQQQLAQLGCEVAALNCAVSAAEQAVDACGSAREQDVDTCGSAREQDVDACGSAREQDVEACGSAREPGVEAHPITQLEPAAHAIAAAKVQAGVTARVAVEVGHAVHAAIGYTREHRLHRYTQRLLSYRAEFGAERVFARWLGVRAMAGGSDRLWEQLLQPA